MTFRRVYHLSLFLGSCLLAVSCSGRRQGPSEAERSAFGQYVNRLDTAQMERSMRQILQADTSKWKADQTVRQRYADIKQYEDMPLWFSRMGVSTDADSLLALLRRELPRHGLDTTAFYVPLIARDLEIVHSLAFDSLGVNINDVLPRLDYHLSKAFVRYTMGLRYGFVRPDRLFNRLEYKAKGDDYARLFDYDVKAPDYAEAIGQLAKGGRIDYLRQSAPSGIVYRKLMTRLDSVTDKAERRKLAINMERCRWQTRQPDVQERRIVVNIPSQQLWAACPDSAFSMRICCGATTNKTPLLASAISYLQVNPEWIIPQNIVDTDVARHAGDSAYFARNNYYIVERATGDTLQPDDMTRSDLESGRLRVGQRGGEGNSLGRIVFRFPNNFAVYLHDTNNRGAFRRERRTLSHGCIRVEKPFELACFLLPKADEWQLDRLRISMDIAPESEQGKKYLEEHDEDPRPFRLMGYQEVAPKMPVYIIYYTIYPNPETGKLETWPDLYGYDKAIGHEIQSLLIN